MKTASADVLSNMFEPNPLMVIFRGLGPHESIRLANLAWGTGIHVIEITLQSPDDVESLEAVVEAGKHREKAIIGAGTVTRSSDVKDAVAAGAAFTVSPGFDVDIVKQSESAGLPSIPGVSTPTEVHHAIKSGLNWLKAFPAAHLGTEWFKALRGPFPEAQFIATGGLRVADVFPLKDAGVRTVALGSALSNPDELAELPTLIKQLQSQSSNAR